MMKQTIFLGGLAFLACTATAAETQRPGESTARWLEMQKGEEQTANDPRPLPGEAAQRSYERYLRSFENEIPEQFESGARND